MPLTRRHWVLILKNEVIKYMFDYKVMALGAIVGAVIALIIFLI